MLSRVFHHYHDHQGHHDHDHERLVTLIAPPARPHNSQPFGFFVGGSVILGKWPKTILENRLKTHPEVVNAKTKGYPIIVGSSWLYKRKANLI